MIRAAMLAAVAALAAAASPGPAAGDGTLSPAAQAMRPEVERGQAAGFDCTVKHPSDVVAGQQCIDHEITKNTANKTLTAGFAIGAYVESVMGTNLKVGVTGENPATPAADGAGGQRRHFFAAEIYRLQHQTGLSDAELCAITRKSCDALIAAITSARGGL
jgi:hypothetical protein